MGETWKPATFERAGSDRAIAVEGYVYRGLGLYLKWWDGKGKDTSEWWLVHLNSGHGVCLISGKVAEALPIATEIAECADWDFDGIAGWRNRDPELPSKVEAIIARHAKQCTRAGGPNSGSEDTAREIGLKRWDAPALDDTP